MKMYLVATVICSLAVSAYSQYSTESPIVKQNKITQIQSIALLPIEFDWYHLTAGGIREYNDAKSIAARSLIMEKSIKVLSKNGFSVIAVDEATADDSVIKCIRPFFDAVNSEILNCVYHTNPLPDARTNFSYTLPPLDALCDRLNVDAVLLVNGFDDCSTPRRKQLKKGAIAGAIAGAVMASLIGFGGYTVIPPDYTIINSALAVGTGEIVWYNFERRTGNIDMTERIDVDKSVATLLARLQKDPK